MKKILIIGAGFLQKFVIQKAKSMGYITLAVDANPDAVGFGYADKHAVINIVDEKACLEYAKSEKIDGVLTAATDYGVLTAAYIAQEMNLPGLKYDVAKIIKNKYRVRKCLYENNVDDTEQSYEINRNTDIEDLSKKIIYPVMVKPCDGSGSRGASKVESACELEEACRYAIDSSITHTAEIETFIDGCEYGAETLVVNGEPHVLAVMKKYMTKPPYYAELGHAIPCGLDSALEDKIKSCVENAIRALGINFGSVNMDLIVTDDRKVYIVDIGARMGGNLIGSHIIPYGTGIDYMGNMIRNAVGDEVNLSPNSKQQAVQTRLLALKPGKVKEIPCFDRISSENDVIIEHHIEIDDVINEYHTNLDGLGYVVCLREDVGEAEKMAVYVKDMIDNELIRY